MARPANSQPSAQNEPPVAFSTATRTVLSLLIALHLAAVFLGPFATPVNQNGSRPLARQLSGWLGRYAEAAYLNNGYKFFAPNPGPSHVIRYVAVLPDGSQVEQTFPDPERHWPRLFYHRHFMLTEKLPFPPPEGQEDREHPFSKALREEWSKSYARRILDKHGAEKVILFHRQHYLPRMQEIREGLDPFGPSYYEERKIGEFTREELLGPTVKETS